MESILIELEKFLERFDHSTNNFSEDEEELICDYINEVSDKGLKEAENILWKFLDYPDELIKELSIQALGRIRSERFKQVALDLLKDKNNSDSIRSSAFYSWMGYELRKKDKNSLRECLFILKDKFELPLIRIIAYIAIINICDDCRYPMEIMDISKISDNNSQTDVEQKVDWERVHSLIKQYAPEALLQEPA